MVLSPTHLKELAGIEPGEPVLSVYCRTDPRDPGNRGESPGWLVGLRNGLRDLTASLEQGGTRDDRLALRSLGPQAERRLRRLSGAQRGRSIAWFVTPGGSLDRFFSLQLPLPSDAVAWDARPFISPLVEVVDRGRSTGLALVGNERVRLLHWEQGIIEEPERSTFDLELGDWRRYEAYAPSNPAMAQQTATNLDAFEDRVETWRERFFETAARHTAERLRELGWERVLVAAETQVASAFAAALPDEVRSRLIGKLAVNIVDRPRSEIVTRVESAIHDAWKQEAVRSIEVTLAAAKSGGAGAIGVDDTVAALREGRVERLIVDPELAVTDDPSPAESDFLQGAPHRFLAERAVEAAILADADVVALGGKEAELLAEVGGMAAMLRY